MKKKSSLISLSFLFVTIMHSQPGFIDSAFIPKPFLNYHMSGARMAFESVTETWLQLHPQVVVERDKVLRHLGPETIAEREKWLSKVEELKDEWAIERKIQLLIDKGEIQNAKELLLSAPFQKVHQTYTRTGLWQQITTKQNIPFLPIPTQLGEDKLANFGAYREYE